MNMSGFATDPCVDRANWKGVLSVRSLASAQLQTSLMNGLEMHCQAVKKENLSL